MVKNTSSDTDENDKQQLEQLRALILGQDMSLVSNKLKAEARNVVGDVLAEAIHDRQKKDGAINKVLQPLVENSVENSVENNSERMVSSLYPLVGSLVRKSVTAFLTDFMEKTNQLIENSFTFKGIKWRINAWQSGVSFAQYVASMTFVYRVEHVLLIHRETGILLKSVDYDSEIKSDADLISSMLSAINDFVGDSFIADEDGIKEQLQTVSTDSFTLLIKPGPEAIVVAAVSGNPPHAISNQLQLTLEDIHQMYFNELRHFDGDCSNFDNTDGLLRDCLLSEQKADTENKKKTPWFAWIIVGLIIILFSLNLYLWQKEKQLANQIQMLDNLPGVIVKSIHVSSLNDVSVDLMRDPDAINIENWLKENEIEILNLRLNERPFVSLNPEIALLRAKRVIQKYPNVLMQTKDNIIHLSGRIDVIQKEALLNQLFISGFSEGRNLAATRLKTKTSLIKPSNDLSAKLQIFKQIIGRISAAQLNFSVASAEITPDMALTLSHLTENMSHIDRLANELNFDVTLLIMGASDTTGNKAANSNLSIKRAENAATSLNSLGISWKRMFITGLGQIESVSDKSTSRKVIFNVLYASKQDDKTAEMDL